jgi:hypothetical protein
MANKTNIYYEEHKYTQEKFNKTVKRLPTGRYVVKIPFKNETVELSD